MPDPMHILLVPPHKTAYKRITRSRISEYWSSKLSTATTMPSLALLRTPSLRLSSGPHPIWTTCLSPHQVRIATIQAKMLAGTYRTCYQGTGACLLPDCGVYPGDLTHLFSSCSFLHQTIIKYTCKAKAFLGTYPFLWSLYSGKLSLPSSQALQFILDPSTDPAVLCLPPAFSYVALPLLFHTSQLLIWAIYRARL